MMMKYFLRLMKNIRQSALTPNFILFYQGLRLIEKLLGIFVKATSNCKVIIFYVQTEKVTVTINALPVTIYYLAFALILLDMIVQLTLKPLIN